MKNCQICLVEFSPKVHNQNMCSAKCVASYRANWARDNRVEQRNNAKQKECVCNVCSKTFYVSNNLGRPKSCSPECREISCKSRLRKWGLNRKYGISLSDYDQKLKDQDFRCEICQSHHTEFRNGLYVDHNHDSGDVRGLLCRDCNAAIGLMKENEKAFNRAIDYLKKHSKSENNLRSIK